MENWIQKYENNKEKTEEDILQIQLAELIDLVDNAKYYEENKKFYLQNFTRNYCQFYISTLNKC